MRCGVLNGLRTRMECAATTLLVQWDISSVRREMLTWIIMVISAYRSSFLEEESLNPAGKMNEYSFLPLHFIPPLTGCHTLITSNDLHNQHV